MFLKKTITVMSVLILMFGMLLPSVVTAHADTTSKLKIISVKFNYGMADVLVDTSHLKKMSWIDCVALDRDGVPLATAVGRNLSSFATKVTIIVDTKPARVLCISE
jgi:hypothetical protein